LTLLSSHGCRRSGSGLRRTLKRLGAASALRPQHQQTPQGPQQQQPLLLDVQDLIN
jgi:hypothetical protein